jgi:hypothetical protein
MVEIMHEVHGGVEAGPADSCGPVVIPQGFRENK